MPTPTPLKLQIEESDPLSTSKGLLPLSALRREVVEEIAPCGRAWTIRYFHDGDLVRQDVAVAVEGYRIGAEVGDMH